MVHFVVCEKQAYSSLHLCFESYLFFPSKQNKRLKKIPFNLYQIQMSLSLSVSIEKKDHHIRMTEIENKI